MSFPYRFVCINVKRTLHVKQDPLYGDYVLILHRKNLDVYWLDCKRKIVVIRRKMLPLFYHCNLTNTQVWLNYSRYSAAAFKSLYPIPVLDVRKQSERLTEGVVDLTVRMEFSANVLTSLYSHYHLLLLHHLGLCSHYQ